MRTTLDLDDDILAAARSIAAARKQTIGKVVSELVRRSLATRVKKMPSGIPLLPHRPGVIVTNELIEKLREEEGISSSSANKMTFVENQSGLADARRARLAQRTS